MKTPFEEVFDTYTALSVILKRAVNEPININIYNKIVAQVCDNVYSVVHHDIKDAIDE